MKYSIVSNFKDRAEAELLVLPFWEGGKGAFDFQVGQIEPVLKSGDFKGKKEETAIFYSSEKEPRILLLGLGKEDKISVEILRRAYASVVKLAKQKKIKTVNLVFPMAGKLEKKDVIQGLGEGVFLTNYGFHLKSDKSKEILLESFCVIGLEHSDIKIFDSIAILAKGVYFVRDLVNGNADEITPEYLARTAEKIAKESKKIECKIFDKKKIEEEKMGLLLAVNRGSNLDPYFIQLSYRGNPHSKDHIVLIGKGVTYDTGGLSLKPTEGMLSMKCDMAGAATVLGVVRTAEMLGLSVNVTAVVPTTENGIDAKSFKLGDVYRSYSGKTVEITNTDAEGRLILADALSYAVKNLNPTHLIDIATLTGAIVIALGEEIAGYFTPNEELVQKLNECSKKTDELLWQMPLNEDYKEATLHSEIADMVNCSTRDAGSMKAAFFLQEFVEDTPWAHIDFAGPSYLTRPKYYYPTKGTGFGLRLLIEFLKGFS